MAADNTLLARAQHGEAWLRLYRWNPACLSFGRNEPATTRYNREQIEHLGLDVVRRPTGGRAVWHEAEITYAMAAPVSAFPSLGDSYRLIHELIARSLQGLGVSVSLAGRPAGRHAPINAGACFAAPAGGEVVAGGRKLVGSAQVREGAAFLQHGSILLGDGQDLVTRITRGTAALPSATSLRSVTGRAVSFTEVAEAIQETASESWGGSWTPGQLELDPLALARFGDTGWTWRR